MSEPDERSESPAVIERLLAAHVRAELATWQSPQFEHNVAERVRALFSWFARIKLDDVVKRAQIAGVIERYVIELRVSGGITELSGEMSRVVFASQTSAETPVSEIVAPASYEDFSDKLIGLERVRRELIRLFAHSETFTTISARLLARGVLNFFPVRVPVDPGVLSAGLSELVQRVLPPLERRLVEGLAHYLELHRERLARDTELHLLEVVDSDRLRSMLDDLWQSVAAMRLSEAFALLGEQDLEDFVILVFEFWQRYRKTPYFRKISNELIDHFFTKYGQETLTMLIEDMGVDEQMVIDELCGFLGPLVDQAVKTGWLEQQIRARLEAFYRSAAARAALGTPATIA